MDLYHYSGSHAALQKSKSIPKTIKAHEVPAVATLLQLCNKVDLKTVMKAGPAEAPSHPSTSEISAGPPLALNQTGISVCGSIIVFAALEPEQADCPPFFLSNSGIIPVVI